MQRKFGLLHSLITYYGNPVLAARLKHVYGRFLYPGALYFDVGAHVGNRVFAARRLGARIIAVEPHPQFFALLERLYGNRSSITLVRAAVGARRGAGTLIASSKTPTVSTLSASWISLVQQDAAFGGVRWDSVYAVTVTTLDDLIARFGVPDFCKIDVEGSELEALHGLSTVLPALSFEFLPAAMDIAVACIHRLESQSRYVYNWCVAERFQFGSEVWLPANEMINHLNTELIHGKSGDVYARRQPGR